MITKLTSMFMTVILTLFTLFPASLGAKNDRTLSEEDLKNLTSVSDYVNYIQEYGAPSMDSATFYKALSPFAVLRRFTTGQIFSEREETYLNVQMDDTLREMTAFILENTGLDIEGIVTHIPNALGPIGALKRTLTLDLSSVRQEIFNLSDRARTGGQTAIATLIYLFGIYFSVVDDIKIYAAQGEGNTLKVLMDVTYRDGTTETVNPDILIDTEKNLAYAAPGYGVAGTGFEVDLNELLLYTVVNAWQRDFGFGLGYDILANSTPAFIYNTRRYKFSYGGKDWMIQVWKGNYALVTNGGEVGVYNREPGRIGTFYNAASDEDMLVMSMEIYRGEERILSRAPALHWWMTGFKLTKNIFRPADLTMKFTIEMKDEEMLQAFISAIDNEASHDLSYTVDGLTVSAEW